MQHAAPPPPPPPPPPAPPPPTPIFLSGLARLALNTKLDLHNPVLWSLVTGQTQASSSKQTVLWENCEERLSFNFLMYDIHNLQLSVDRCTTMSVQAWDCYPVLWSLLGGNTQRNCAGLFCLSVSASLNSPGARPRDSWTCQWWCVSWTAVWRCPVYSVWVSVPVLTPLVPDLETAGSVGGVCLESQSGGVRFILSVGASLNSPGARPRDSWICWWCVSWIAVWRCQVYSQCRCQS